MSVNAEKINLFNDSYTIRSRDIMIKLLDIHDDYKNCTTNINIKTEKYNQCMESGKTDIKLCDEVISSQIYLQRLIKKLQEGQKYIKDIRNTYEPIGADIYAEITSKRDCRVINDTNNKMCYCYTIEKILQIFEDPSIQKNIENMISHMKKLIGKIQKLGIDFELNVLEEHTETDDSQPSNGGKHKKIINRNIYMKRRTTKRRTTKRRTTKRRRRTMKRRPRKIMVGGEKETVDEREIRKKAEKDKIENETYEEKTKRENLDIDRKQEAKEIIEQLKTQINSKETKVKPITANESQYNNYMINACGDKIVKKYGKDIRFINEYIQPDAFDFNDEKEKPKYPFVYLHYKDDDKITQRIEKHNLSFIWPWDWDDYIMSYANFNNFIKSAQTYDNFIKEI